jgi:hypothetical protein
MGDFCIDSQPGGRQSSAGIWTSGVVQEVLFLPPASNVLTAKRLRPTFSPFRFSHLL